MDLSELEQRTGMKRRQIRYLISLKLLPNPDGATRNASYSDTHVEAIQRYQLLESTGVKARSLAERAPILPITLEPIPGVTVAINPGTVPPDFDPGKFLKAFVRSLSRHFKEPTDADDHA